MKSIKRTNQSGSSAMFIIVGVVLFLGLISSVYFVKTQGDQARKDQAIASYEKQKADEKKSSTEGQGVTNDDKTSSEANDNKGSVSDGSSNAIISTNLPATGPEMALLQSIGVGFIAMSISAYLLSRRNLVRYL